MVSNLYDLLERAARLQPDAVAVRHRSEKLSFGELNTLVRKCVAGLQSAGLSREERVGIYLEKRFEAIASIFATGAAGAVFVPINPKLRPRQVQHILTDCAVRVLITSRSRFVTLSAALPHCDELKVVVLVADGEESGDTEPGTKTLVKWDELVNLGDTSNGPARTINRDMAAILYTSGSTGLPKGVVLSHENVLVGAESVSEYLANTPDDRILATLPLSFDYGLSQVTTSVHVGATVVLQNYLFPQDVIREVVSHQITGLACVPPLWTQLSRLEWPEEARSSLRYITNSGGAMPLATLERLRRLLPGTDVFLMYGLTEAFRSTYLPPSEIERRPGSIGKAIPNAEVLVVNDDGDLCEPGEHGELVHRGALVSLGYWNAPEATAERFRPAPARPDGIPVRETAVWSGDVVWADEEGFLYFVGRRDHQIKTSGYRVSPAEIEEVVHASGLVKEVAATGVPHPTLGQAIVLAVVPEGATVDEAELIGICQEQLPSFMVPVGISEWTELPRNPNGKIDRTRVAEELTKEFAATLERQGRR